MTETLTITQSVYDEMITHSKELKPIESCGYLAGNEMSINRLYK